MATRNCWNCGKDAHHTMHSDVIKAHNGDWFATFQCDSCRVLSIGSSGIKGISRSDVKIYMMRPDASLQWLPARKLGREFEHVPHPVNAAASEAWACYSVNQFRASVLMARAVVEAAAKEQGFTSGNLMSKIDSLYGEEIIGKGVKEAAHEIRFLGNDMAHGDFVTEIEEEECADVLTFLEEFLNEVYQRPAKLGRFRENRLARNQETG